MAAPTTQQVESWLPFVERVGLPWVLVFVLLAILVFVIVFASIKFLPVLNRISVDLAATSASNNKVAEEIRHNTPPLGTPVIPDVLLTLHEMRTDLQNLQKSFADVILILRAKGGSS